MTAAVLATHLKPVQSLPIALAPLAELPRWCVWRWREAAGGKHTKVPHRAAHPTAHARVNDSTTWGSYADAISAVEAGRADGIGFMLHGGEIGALDLDDCREPDTGDIAPWAMRLVDQSESYAEVTVSGTGLRILGHATGEHVHRNQPWPGTTGRVETYRRAARFIVITGHELAHGPGELVSLDPLIDDIVGRLDAPRWTHRLSFPLRPIGSSLLPETPERPSAANLGQTAAVYTRPHPRLSAAISGSTRVWSRRLHWHRPAIRCIPISKR